MSNVFLACPTHDGRIDIRTAKAIYYNATNGKHQYIPAINQGSLLANNCNQLWAMALNNRKKHNLKWFAMLHSDVIPEPYWLDKMIELAENSDADLLSAVIPIKDDRGLTSTAISTEDPFNVMLRLTMKQVLHEDMPTVFGIEDVKAFLVNTLVTEPEHLLVNTGCMVCRIDKEWADELKFQISDEIRFAGENAYVMVEPEDWYFSRIVAELGGKVRATKQVQVKHVGFHFYDNKQKWGLEIDDHFNAQNQTKIKPKVFIDCGLHHGEGLRKFKDLLNIKGPEWSVFCFEPNPACNLFIANNIYKYVNVQIHGAAVWVHDGTVEFCQEDHTQSASGSPKSPESYSPLDGWASCIKDLNSKAPGLQKPIEVPCIDFSKWIEQFRDCEVYCKMDIEGAEFPVLRKILADGNAGIFKKIWVEFHRFIPGEDKNTIRQLMEELSKYTSIELWH